MATIEFEALRKQMEAEAEAEAIAEAEWEADPEAELFGNPPSMADAVVIGFASVALLMWLAVVALAISRARRHAADRLVLYVRRLDVCMLLGASLLLWAPFYLAGEPTKELCHLRTSLLPVGLTALGSGAIAKIFLTSRIVSNEWRARTNAMTAAAARAVSQRSQRQAMFLVYAATAPPWKHSSLPPSAAQSA